MEPIVLIGYGTDPKRDQEEVCSSIKQKASDENHFWNLKWILLWDRCLEMTVAISG